MLTVINWKVGTAQTFNDQLKVKHGFDHTAINWKGGSAQTFSDQLKVKHRLLRSAGREARCRLREERDHQQWPALAYSMINFGSVCCHFPTINLSQLFSSCVRICYAFSSPLYSLPLNIILSFSRCILSLTKLLKLGKNRKIWTTYILADLFANLQMKQKMK